MPSRIPRPNRADTELAVHQEADNKENSTNLGRDISIAVDKVEGVKLARAPKGATTMSERQALRPKNVNGAVGGVRKRGAREEGSKVDNLEKEGERKKAKLRTDSGSVDVPEQEVALWESTRESMGWSEVDCLNHKLSLPKRGDPGKKVETLGQHVKRLRALGWYLYREQERKCIECFDLENELDEKSQQLETLREEAEQERQLAQTKEISMKKEIEEALSDGEKYKNEIKGLQDKIEQVEGQLQDATKLRQSLEGQLKDQQAKLESVETKLQTAEASQLESQKYAMTLQEYNSKLQSEISAANDTIDVLRKEKAELTEEKAELSGRVQALGDALEALQHASSSTEAARQDACEELSRVRGELAACSAEKISLTQDLVTAKDMCNQQRADLERYQAATGKDLAALEEEKANAAALSKRTKAQAETVNALQDQLELMKEQRGAAEARCDSMSAENRSLKARIAELEVLLPAMEERLRDSESVRRRLHNTVLELKGNVRVFCRIRPLMPAEGKSNDGVSVAAIKGGELAGRGLEIEQTSQGAKGKNLQKHTFTFDRVFGPQSSQNEVFEEVSMLVQSALDGYRVCIFAYGQTGSGKTHTMLGDTQDEGIIPRSVRQVFATADSAVEQGWKYHMKAAMLEIYNEDIKDLLGAGPPEGKKHVISNADTGKASGVEVSFLEWVDVASTDDVSSLLKKAMSQRSVGVTACNEHSSRSHMVFMLAVEGSNEATGQKLSGALNLVDLAGSERVDKSEVKGERLKETQAINKSLSALGDVIAALGSKEGHIPYRNSKLTFLLQNSLSGSGKALMLCNVGPSCSSSSESLCTLRFAAKVNATNIGTARRNIE